MSVKFNDNTAKIIFDTNQGVSLALRFMLDGIDQKSFPKTPKDKGNLRKDILKQVLGKKATIIWLKNYAVYQETKQFKNYTTPGTGPGFAEDAVRDAVRNSQYFLKKARLI